MNTWLMVTSEESFNATARAGVLGFYGNQAGHNLISQTAVGDRIIFYITKKKVLRGLFEIASEPYLDESRLYGDHRDTEWNQRLKLRVIDARAEADIYSVCDHLEFTNKSLNFGMYLLKTLRKLPPADVETITSAMGFKTMA